MICPDVAVVEKPKTTTAEWSWEVRLSLIQQWLHGELTAFVTMQNIRGRVAVVACDKVGSNWLFEQLLWNKPIFRGVLDELTGINTMTDPQ